MMGHPNLETCSTGRESKATKMGGEEHSSGMELPTWEVERKSRADERRHPWVIKEGYNAAHQGTLQRERALPIEICILIQLRSIQADRLPDLTHEVLAAEGCHTTRKIQKKCQETERKHSPLNHKVMKDKETVRTEQEEGKGIGGKGWEIKEKSRQR